MFNRKERNKFFSKQHVYFAHLIIWAKAYFLPEVLLSQQTSRENLQIAKLPTRKSVNIVFPVLSILM